MNPWVVLGLEPCPDRKRIRKAYVLKLKETHPEDDPEGFKELRRAYEMVLAFLDVAFKTPPEIVVSEAAPEARRDVEPAVGRDHPESPDVPAPRVVPFLRPQAHDADSVARLMARAHDLEDAGLSSSSGLAAAWRSLLDDDALWNLDTRGAFERELFEHLARSRVELEHEIWRLLEEEFHWREQSLALYRGSLERESVDHVLTRIHRASSWSRLAHLRLKEIEEPAPHAFQWLESLGEGESEEPRTILDGARDLWSNFDVGWFVLGLFVLILLTARLSTWRSTEGLQARSVPTNAITRLELAAERGSPTAAMELAEHLRSGDEVPEDSSRAVELLIRAARFGHPRAMRRLGDASREGWVETDYEESVRWYRLAAEQDDPLAQWRLGAMIREGMGTPKDAEAAFRWMKKAADNGLTIAQAWAGYLHERGEGVERDELAAVTWYRRAAAQDHSWSQFQLGRLYLNGAAVERDEDEAAFWLTLASRDPSMRGRAAERIASLTGAFEGERGRALEARIEAWDAARR